jgi:hypothetical protein
MQGRVDVATLLSSLYYRLSPLASINGAFPGKTLDNFLNNDSTDTK